MARKPKPEMRRSLVLNLLVDGAQLPGRVEEVGRLRARQILSRSILSTATLIDLLATMWVLGIEDASCALDHQAARAGETS